MRHQVAGRKLGRTTAHRQAMLANMAASLVISNRIETTLHKAKELKPLADRLVTLGKRQTLHARRKAMRMVHNRRAVQKVFDELANRFADRSGGYTRIYKLGSRHGDCAPMAAIEYLPAERAAEEIKEEGAKKKVKKAKAKEEAPKGGAKKAPKAKGKSEKKASK